MRHAYGSLLLTLFLGGFAVWGWIAWRLLSRLPILPREPRRDVPWGLVDLLLTFALYVLLSLSAVSALPIERVSAEKDAKVAAEQVDKPAPKLTLNGWRTMIALDSSVKLLVVALMFVFILVRYQATLADLGVSFAHFGLDVQLGVTTFLAIYLPMIGLQAALVFGLKWKYEHPLIESVTETKDLMLFSIAAIATAVTAPLFEEFIFRGLLQGWLEKLYSGSSTREQLVTGGREEFDFELLAPQPSIEQKPFDDNPYASPVLPEDAFSRATNNVFTRSTSRDWLALVASTIIFSLLHYSHGPAWIPLLIFGAATGFVYQRTHRILPGIVAHFLLNATTMFGLWVQVFGPEVPK